MRRNRLPSVNEKDGYSCVFTLGPRAGRCGDPGRQSVHKIFSMSVEGIAAADKILDQAFRADPRAAFLARRIQLRVIQRMERHFDEDPIAHDELKTLVLQAVRLKPGNSMVLSAASNARKLIEDDVAFGIELARRAMLLNPANPFAWDCLSIGLMMEGKFEALHRHQLHVGAISARSPIRHFRDIGAGLTSVVTGRLDEARRLAHSASVLVPDLRPPLRYMAALDGMRGEFADAEGAVRWLAAMEPDFSLRRMIEDPNHPVAARRRGGLLADARLKSLAT